MLGVFDGEKIELSEIHRFSNDPVELNGRFVWDLPRLFYDVKQALVKVANQGIKLDAIGIDTWGVDFGLLDKNGNLSSMPSSAWTTPAWTLLSSCCSCPT